MNTFPNRIRFLYDNNEAVLKTISQTRTSKVLVAYYEYVVSETKKGKEFPFTLDEIKKMNHNSIIEVLND